MYAAMDVGVLRPVIAVERVDDRSRFLTGCAVVEIHQRLAVNLLLENRKILAQAHDIEAPARNTRIHKMRYRFHQDTQILRNLATIYSSNFSRKESILIRPTTSAANAKLKRLRASSSPSPRERR